MSAQSSMHRSSRRRGVSSSLIPSVTPLWSDCTSSYRPRSPYPLACRRFVELPTIAGLEFATSSVPIAVVAALVIAVIAALAGTLVLQARLVRRTRALARELEHRQRAEAQLQDIRGDLEHRVRERTQALEARNEELSRVRLAL